MKRNVLFILFLCSLKLSLGQDSAVISNANLDMITNRPGATEASRAVYHKGFQIETGIEFGQIPDWKGSKSNKQYLFLPNFNLQYGVSKNVELRVSSTHYASRDKINDGYTQFVYMLDNIVLGAKINLLKSKGFRPELALLITQSIPSNFSDNTKYWPTTILMAWSYSLPKNFSLSGNLAYLHQMVENDQFLTVTPGWSYTFNAGYAIKENIGVFAEIFGSDDFDDSENASVTLDGGIWYRINPKFQIDASAGYGTDVGNYYLNAGFSYLFLK